MTSQKLFVLSINKTKEINKLQIVLHILGYQFCSPGTKLKQLLAQAQLNINPIDKACHAWEAWYGNT